MLCKGLQRLPAFLAGSCSFEESKMTCLLFLFLSVFQMIISNKASFRTYSGESLFSTMSTVHQCFNNDRVVSSSAAKSINCCLTSTVCNPVSTWTHLVVHLQWVSFPFGLEALCVGVHCEVNLLVEALYMNRVPVLVIQQTAHSDRNTMAAEPRSAIIFTNRRPRRQWADTSPVMTLYLCMYRWK